MKKEALVSVVIAAYNCEKYIKDSINSILSQSYHNFEVVIVDDGSTDQTIDTILSIDDNRIKLFRNDKNRGIPYTRNRLLEYSKGDYIAVLDADDIADSTRLQKQVDFLSENEEIDVAGSYYKVFGNKFSRVIKTPFRKPDEIHCYLMFYNNIANPTVMFKKEFIDKHNIQYDEKFFVAQDYEFWTRIISSGGKIAIIPEALTKYRVGHSNISKMSKKNKGTERRKLIDSIHKNYLIYNNFKLSNEELEFYNQIFSDNLKHHSVLDVKIFTCIFEKLKQQNIIVGSFEHGIFNNILIEVASKSINNMDLNIKDKMLLLKKTMKITGNRDITYFMRLITKPIIKRVINKK